jgi:predicted Fe-Mo cluster-binding NifX family protein
MRIAVSSTGLSADAWINGTLDTCPRFLVVDSESMGTIIVSVPDDVPPGPERTRMLLRAVLSQDVQAIITGPLSEACRQVMDELGIEIVEGIERMTVRQAVEAYVASGRRALAEYVPPPQKVAVGSHGDDLEATLHARGEPCTSFVLVDPQTMAYEVVRVAQAESMAQAGVNAVRAAARNGATTVITSEIRPACCTALNALGIAVFLADEHLTVREAIEAYLQGELTPSTAL